MKTVSTDTALLPPLFITDMNPVGVDLNFPITNFRGNTNGLALNLTLAKDADNTNTGPGHTWVGDLNMTLTVPSAASHIIMQRTGRGTSGAGDSSNADAKWSSLNLSVSRFIDHPGITVKCD